MIPDVAHRVWDGQVCQSCAIPKGIIPNVGHRVRDGQVCQRRATGKGTIPNVGHRVWDGQALQRAAVSKSGIPDVGHRVWDGQVCQRAATLKGSIPDVGHRIRDGQLHQRAATTKGIIPDVRHRVRDGQLGQGVATLESEIINPGFIVGNFDHKQQLGVNDATKTGDRMFVGAYDFVGFEDNAYNSIFSNSSAQYLCIIGQQMVVSDNNLYNCGAASELVVPTLALLDLLLECPACCLWCDFNCLDFTTRL